MAEVTRDEVRSICRDLVDEHGRQCPMAQRVESLEKSRGEQYDRLRELEKGQTKIETLLGVVSKAIDGLSDKISTLSGSIQSQALGINNDKVAVYKWVIGILVALIMALLTTYVFIK